MLSDLFLVRWEQIKRYLHIKGPDHDNSTEASSWPWYQQVKWLFDHFMSVSRKNVDPGNGLSYDEAMIRNKGRSFHTVKQKNKPIR